jgi:hypothetical protein
MEGMVVFITAVPGCCYYSWPEGIYLTASAIFCEVFDMKLGSVVA